jgi:hypothetical protein
MAFLDNSGDIILDAVLTDHGRKLLAKGDGSFRIAKFALGDDEIDYSLYVSATGSAYTDLSILQTPCFEAFTNNRSSMNSKLLSIADNNLLYLPVIKVNQLVAGSEWHSDGTVKVAVNTTTANAFADSFKVMNGADLANNPRFIRLDQGFDNIAQSPKKQVDSSLLETIFYITVDNRFGTINSIFSGKEAPIAYIDEDNKKTYVVTLGNDQDFVQMNGVVDENVTTETLAGSKGTTLKFAIGGSVDLSGGSHFAEYGASVTLSDDSGTSPYNSLSATVVVEGGSTGFRREIPVTFIRST